ncbi:tetratricopeptide repeat protein [Sandaracinus amylolyticus]|nr:tetratricopeptide repeat protein [Sandaracinus amylolyticus]
MFFGTREDEAQRLHEEALARIDGRDLAGAREIARQLRGMRWSGAFEIEALAARAEGDLEGAVRVLEEGVGLAPGAWSLQQLLGTLCSELGRLDRALEALDAALRCEGVWVSSVRYNRAVARMRGGDVGGALADAESVLEDPATPPFTLDALRVAIDALARLGRADDAISLVRAVSSSLAKDDVDGRAALAAFDALARARAGRGEDEVRGAIERAVEGLAMRSEVIDALALLPAPEARVRYRVTISAPRPPDAPVEIEGYLRVFEVRAHDEAHAVALARALEPSSLRSAIAVEDVKVLGEDRGPARVVFASGRALFGA